MKMNLMNRLIGVFIWTCVVKSSYQVNWQGNGDAKKKLNFLHLIKF